MVAVADAAADGGTRTAGVDDEYPYESDANDDAGVVDTNGRLQIPSIIQHSIQETERDREIEKNKNTEKQKILN